MEPNASSSEGTEPTVDMTIKSTLASSGKKMDLVSVLGRAHPITTLNQSGLNNKRLIFHSHPSLIGEFKGPDSSLPVAPPSF